MSTVEMKIRYRIKKFGNTYWGTLVTRHGPKSATVTYKLASGRVVTERMPVVATAAEQVQQARKCVLIPATVVTPETTVPGTPTWSKSQIDWVIDRLHVSASESDIRAELEPRMTDAGWAIPGTDGFTHREAAIRYAISRHDRNRALYNRVVGGTR